MAVPTRLAFGQADCPQCDFKVDAKNAMGLAAQHAKRTGHNAWTVLTYISYGDQAG